MKFGKHLGSILGIIMIMSACSKTEPTATTYKSKLASSDSQSATGNPTPEVKQTVPAPTGAAGDKAALVTQGTAAWNSKCMGCHGTLDKTDKIGAVATPQNVIEAKSVPSHAAIAAWPADKEAEAIYTVLNP